MRIIINENQYRTLLLEGSLDSWGEIIQYYTDRFKNTIIPAIKKEFGKRVKGNLEFMLKWGAGIGGFIGPVEDFIRGEFPNLSDTEVYLLLIAIASTIFFKEKETTSEINALIEEEKLSKALKEINKKGSKIDSLTTRTKQFFRSFGFTIKEMTNILAYTFLLPIIPSIVKMFQETNFDVKEISNIVDRLVAFSTVTLTNITIEKFLTKLSFRVNPNTKSKKTKDS